MANKKRLIDVSDENVKAVLEKVPYYPDEIWKFTAMTNRFPTLKAVPVVYGRWENIRFITTGDGRARIGDCSSCRSIERVRNYCPNCGAKMDGDGNE